VSHSLAEPFRDAILKPGGMIFALSFCENRLNARF
jgi:hypothetical protein